MPVENLYHPPFENEKCFLDLDSDTITSTKLISYSASQLKNGFDLNEELIRNKPATFFMRVNSDVMKDAGIFKNDIVIVDRSLKAATGNVIIAMLGGDILIRQFEKNNKKIRLFSDPQKLAPINIDANCEDFEIRGVVTYVIHKL